MVRGEAKVTCRGEFQTARQRMPSKSRDEQDVAATHANAKRSEAIHGELEFLEERLAQLETDWRPPIAEAFQIQLTANVAEFLFAWYNGATELD